MPGLRSRNAALTRGKSKIVRKASANAMLDLYAVKTQIDNMVVDERLVQEDFRAKLELALAEEDHRCCN